MRWWEKRTWKLEKEENEKGKERGEKEEEREECNVASFLSRMMAGWLLSKTALHLPDSPFPPPKGCTTIWLKQKFIEQCLSDLDYPWQTLLHVIPQVQI